MGYYIIVYLDDVIVVGRDFEEHLSNFKLLFERLRQNNLKLKLAKCSMR